MLRELQWSVRGLGEFKPSPLLSRSGMKRQGGDRLSRLVQACCCIPLLHTLELAIYSAYQSDIIALLECMREGHIANICNLTLLIDNADDEQCPSEFMGVLAVRKTANKQRFAVIWI